MKNQRRNKLALRKETVRALDQVELKDIAGGGIVLPPTHQLGCPSVHICLTTPVP